MMAKDTHGADVDAFASVRKSLPGQGVDWLES